MIFRVKDRLVDVRQSGRHVMVWSVEDRPKCLATLVQHRLNAALSTGLICSEPAPLFEQLEKLVAALTLAGVLRDSFSRAHLTGQNGVSRATC